MHRQHRVRQKSVGGIFATVHRTRVFEDDGEIVGCGLRRCHFRVQRLGAAFSAKTSGREHHNNEGGCIRAGIGGRGVEFQRDWL